MNKEINEMIKRVEKKFNGEATNGARDYFIGYGIVSGRKATVNIIMDDRDVERMNKKALIKTLQNMINPMNPDPSKIIPKVVLISDLNEKNIWQYLGDSACIENVKSLITFFNVSLPEGFREAFDELENEFKLDDFRRELKKITNKEYHRNTYQNWLNFLRNAEYITLKNKTYIKTQRFNRDNILKRIIKK